MSIDVVCDICQETLEEKGALAFTPPSKNNRTKKFHFCKDCWYEIKTIFKLV